MIRWVFASTCLLTSGAAFAQQSTVAPSDSQQEAISPPSISAVNDDGISDIVVTASRRAENVQRSALSIQAISGEEIARRGIARPEDLSTIAPGVSVASGGNYPQTYIRGVGTYASNTYSEGAVAYNIDGIYVSRGWATRGAFFDVSRVEVLKGPQGTLYGRNASGGAVNIITVRPKLGQTEGFVEMEAGNYDFMRGSAAVNVPIGDTLALRASGQITHREGYLSDGYDDDKSQSARLHLLWEPSSDVSLLLTGGYQHIGGQGAGSVANPNPADGQWKGITDPAVQAIVQAEPGIGGLLVVGGKDGFANINVYSVSAELNWNMGPATLTVIPAYRDSTLSDRTYIPGFQVNDNEHDKQTTLEVRLGNDGSRFKWVFGGYYFDEDQSNISGRDLLVVRQGIFAQQTTDFQSNIRSYAGFGQATFSVFDSFRLTGGLRYTYERKMQNGQTYAFPFPCSVGDVACPTALQIPLTGKLAYKNWTWKGGFEFDVAPSSMVYGNASTGFKSGGFYAAPEPNTFRPEKILAFDAGIKNRFFDNRVQLNIEGFYWKYKDHQESHLGPTSVPGFYTFITENAGKAKSYGFDIDLVVRPTQADQFSIKAQYNKTKYDTFVYQNTTAVFGPPVTGCAVGPLTNGVQDVDCSGFQLVRSPTWTGTASYQHTFELGSDDTVVAGVSAQYSSSSYLSIDFLPNAQQPKYATVDADLTYTTAGGKLSLTGYVRNITNQGVLTGAFRYPFVSPNNPIADSGSLIVSSIRPPRTYGARLRYNF